MRPSHQSFLFTSSSHYVLSFKMHLSSICATLCLALAVPSVLALPKHKDPPPLPPGTEHGSYALRHNIHTLNELDPAVPCRNVSVIFARGSGNPGNIGKTAQFWDELAKYTGYDDLAVQGVNYWATIISYLFNLYGPGVVDTRERVKKLMVRCPDTSLVLAGYSQGAEVIRTYLEQNATQTEIDFVKTGKSKPDRLQGPIDAHCGFQWPFSVIRTARFSSPISSRPFSASSMAKCRMSAPCLTTRFWSFVSQRTVVSDSCIVDRVKVQHAADIPDCRLSRQPNHIPFQAPSSVLQASE